MSLGSLTVPDEELKGLKVGESREFDFNEDVSLST